jgi:hypothetical protein
MFKTLQWEDWLGVALGVCLLASPLVLGFSDNSPATMNALIMGSILVLEELLDVYIHEAVEEWVDIVAGLWLVVSPAVLGFTSLMPAVVSTVAIGLLTVLLAAWALSPFDEMIRHWWHDHRPSH